MVKELKIKTEYDLYDIVYLVVDLENKPRQIIGYRVDDNSVMYIVKTAYSEEVYYARELSSNKNVIS